MADKKKVLVVEDDAIIAADITSTLTNYGFEVVGPYDNGEEVVHNAPSLKPDVVLMDINLKGELDGIATAEAIQNKIAAPVIFLSALSDEETLRRARLVNPYGYLIKPFDGVELKTNLDITVARFESEVKKGGPARAAQPELEDWQGLSEASSADDRTDFLSRLPLFKGIEPKIMRDISAQCSVSMASAGEFLSIEGEELEGGFIPVTGRISIAKTSESGKELIVALLAPGDCFGFFSFIDTFGSSVSARTQVDSKILWMPKKSWKFLLEREPLIYPNLVDAIATRLSTAYTLASSLAHAKVEDRIIHTLLALMPEFGKSTKKGSSEGRIFMTRKELAELTGTTPETAIRVTKSLEREGILDLTRPGVIKVPNLEILRSYIAAK